MSSTFGRLKKLPGKMDQPRRSNVTSRRIGCLSTFNTISDNDYDGSKLVDGSFNKDVTTQGIELCDTIRLTQNVSTFHSACTDNRRSPCEENDCTTCNCNIMNRRDQDAARKSEARRHSNSSHTHSTRKYYFDQLFRSPIALRADCIGSSGWRIYLLFLIYLLYFMIPCNVNGCAIGLNTPGNTWPPGDIIVEYGDPLQIFCILNQTIMDLRYPGKNSSDLVFFRDEKKLSQEFITIVNSTTIYLSIKKPSPAENMYYCELKKFNEEIMKDPNIREKDKYEGVCLNKVVVGFRPLKPENFSCISFNWEDLTCSWDPVENFISTKFTLMFRLTGRMGRKMYPCPKESPKPLPPNTCMWNTLSTPIYRQPYEKYLFTMYATNVLKNRTFQYNFDHYANVIPAKPGNLTVVNKTLTSALLSWDVRFPMQTFPPGLHYKLMYENLWDGNWTIINITNTTHHKPHLATKFYNLTNLKYANTVYDVRVLMKSAVAADNRWSEFSHVTFRTPPRLPGLPPRTDVGSFEITENNNNRDIYLYWQAISEYQENGNNFKYHIIHVEENGRMLYDKSFKPSETTRSYAKFKGISFNSYKFDIVSMNEVGANKNHAQIFVPSKHEMPDEPLAFTKIAFERGLYELSWKPPIKSKDITNYTLFWCENERDRPYQCTGYLDWVHLANNKTMHNMTVPNKDRVYQFAISANTPKGSSGMIWASCTVIHNKVVGKMKSVWINRIGSHFIEVGWKLDCSDRIGIVEGFNIYYCPILSPYNLNCKGPKLNKTIKADRHTIHGIVDDLMPYTTYMLAISVLTKNGEGLHSDPLYNTTLEAAPSTPPQDITIVNVTNTTMFITWKPPKAMNGVLRYYEVYYNKQKEKVEELTYIELRNLIPFQRYNISVVVCTVACSEKSPVETVYTRVGMPGKINVPAVHFINSSQVLVTWEAPDKTAGPLTNIYYAIEDGFGEIRNTSLLKMELPISDCKVGRERQYKFRVRAVNVVSDGVQLKGPWSDPGEGNCYSHGPSFKVWVFIWILGSLSSVAFLLCFFYIFKRLWLKCQAMRDVEVKLPPGLTPNMKLLQKVNDQHIRQSSADSSGCSSGQESVTSSLTAESQVSSDSGTEVDPVPISPAKLLEDTLPSWESKLRHRGSSAQGSEIAKTEASQWDSYVKVEKSGEPIIGETGSLARSTPNLTDSTGYTTSPHTWSSTGYISMPSSEELSSNPSPVPRENSNVVNTSNIGAQYCVIGAKPEDDNGVMSESNDKPSDALIPKREVTSTTNPYVSMALLEQKQKENQQSAMNSFSDLNKQLSSFVDSSNKLNLNTLSPRFTASDKTTTGQEPYVQTGLLNKSFALNSIEQPAKSDVPICGPFASTSDSCSKPFVSSFATLVTAPLSDIITLSASTKPSVVASQMVELPHQPSTVENKESLSQKKVDSSSHVPVSSENSSSSYVFASPIYRMLQRQKQQKHKRQQQNVPSASVSENRRNDEKKDDASCLALSWQTSGAESGREAATRMPIITRQKSGYVTIVENPDAASATTGDVGQKSDEQYSKMTVAPSTVQ